MNQTTPSGSTPTDSDPVAPIWEPSAALVEGARMTELRRWLEAERGLRFADYAELHSWSVDDLEGFWSALWEFFAIEADGDPSTVLGSREMPGTEWFPGVSLNYAERLLAGPAAGADEEDAILHAAEGRELDSLSWGELRGQVAAVAAGLRQMGVGRGDRVVAYLPNVPEAVVAFLAAASIGAVWSSCSPDFGSASVIDRFAQIEPKVLFAVDGYRYGGRDFDRTDTVAELRRELPTVTTTVLLPYLRADAELPGPGEVIAWDALLAAGEGEPLRFERVPFDHPLWILYSSGTTGLPKAIVQGQGGILIEHLKQMQLHLDLHPGDRFFWFTTTGWMMWNYLVSGLLGGAAIVLYDGNPGSPDLDVLWDLAAVAGVTTFGTSASYLSACMKAGAEPGTGRDLAIRALGSTGSPLPSAGFDWVYEQIGADTWLFSSSGGTDVCTSFIGGVPLLPVYRGELQGPGLGVALEAWDEEGRPVLGEVGELVVTRPMPSMPLYFWNDEDGRRYRESYFEMFPGVWRHGDWLEITPRGSGVIHGRSDSTINRGGIRMGTAEIYGAVLSIDTVVDALVVDLPRPGTDGWISLFVVLREGAELDSELPGAIARRIRERCSPRHVPDEVIRIDEVPRTLTGKALEVPVKRILMGTPVDKALSRDSVANPAALDPFIAIRAAQAGADGAPGTEAAPAPVAASAGRRSFKVTCDVGGTFTDVVATDSDGGIAIGKSLTTPHSLVEGLTAAIAAAGEGLDLSAEELLAATDLFVYATTQATNAVLVGRTARTALLCTEGFPDSLVRREGGSLRPYDFSIAPPEPYIPRRLTFEVPERIGAEGEVVLPLDREATVAKVRELADRGVEAVAVCLLWSMVNPAHELAVGEILEAELPGVPFTLSHQLNPVIREYRRSSCTSIDASLKPVMQAHLGEVEDGLRRLGFAGELLAANSLGGVIPMADLAARPVYAVRSGPSLAPVAGRAYAGEELEQADAVVCDTGGTSFDVSLVRAGEVVTTRETWLGEPFAGHLTGLSSVDARSVGAGGGSIAWIDSGGLLRVGPQSAGADPGPVCYGNGGEEATVTDAALVLGYLDPERFLGGRMTLDLEAAEAAVGRVAEAIGAELADAAAAIVTIANEHMVGAIREITLNQGVDPRESALVAGGGAAGIGIAAIARELDCRRVLLPRTAGALSAFGAQQADIVTETGRSLVTDSERFDLAAVNATLAEIDDSFAALASDLAGRGLEVAAIEHFVEARYTDQVWELEIPLRAPRFEGPDAVAAMVADFHAAHERIFAVTDPGQRVEAVHWKGRLTARPRKPGLVTGTAADGVEAEGERRRRAHFPGFGAVEVPVLSGGSLAPGEERPGPLIIAEPTTTIVVPPDASLRVTALGNYLLEIAP